MFRHFMLAITALVITTPALAATKQEVAAAGCNTLAQARKLDPGADRLRYRLIGDKQCWYSEVTLAKRGIPVKTATEPKDDNRVAGKVPPSVIKRIIKKQAPQEGLSYQDLNPENVTDDLDAIFNIMCGGLCPQLKK